MIQLLGPQNTASGVQELSGTKLVTTDAEGPRKWSDPHPWGSKSSELPLWRAFYTRELQNFKVPLVHSGMAL